MGGRADPSRPCRAGPGRQGAWPVASARLGASVRERNKWTRPPALILAACVEVARGVESPGCTVAGGGAVTGQVNALPLLGSYGPPPNRKRRVRWTGVPYLLYQSIVEFIATNSRLLLERLGSPLPAAQGQG